MSKQDLIDAIAQQAEARGVILAFEAAVAGGIPIIKVLREGLVGNRVRRLYGILNGTCNYILTTMRESGREFADVLAEAQKLFASGERSGDAIRSAMLATIEGEPLATADYVSVADTETLAELDHIETGALVSLAVRIGKTRLIDNVILPKDV